MSMDNLKQIEFWNGDAGAKWVSDQDKMDRMLDPLSDIAIDLAEPKVDERVIDVGCGCGATSVELARRGAKVWGIDVSAPMLSRARDRGADYPGMLFTEADASDYQFSAEHQLIFSRFGVMFFAKPFEAFKNLRTALVPGGRLVFLCWQAANKNEWISRLVRRLRNSCLSQRKCLTPERRALLRLPKATTSKVFLVNQDSQTSSFNRSLWT